MRLVIGHREEKTGILRTGREYFLDCDIQLSEKEKSVIRERRMEEHFVTLPKGHYAVGNIHDIRRMSSLRLAVAGGMALVLTFVFPLINGPWQGFIALAWFTSIGYGIVCFWRMMNPTVEPADCVPIKYIVEHGRFSITAISPTACKIIEGTVASSFEALKAHVEGSVEIGVRSVHEF